MPLLVPLECVVAIAADGSEIVDLITVGIAVAVVLAHAPCPSNVLCPLPSAPCPLHALPREGVPLRRCDQTPLREDVNELDAKALKVGRRDIAFNMHHPHPHCIFDADFFQVRNLEVLAQALGVLDKLLRLSSASRAHPRPTPRR